MRALVSGRWLDGFLDYHPLESECRLKVLGMLNVLQLDDLYFVRPRSLRLVRNYVAEIGLRAALRKVRSRQGERFRNEKYLSVGFGLVLQPGQAVHLAAGQVVQFIAPAHPACAERLTLPTTLVRPHEGSLPFELAESVLLHSASATEDAADPEPLLQLAGWMSFSGIPLGAETEVALDLAHRWLMHPGAWSGAQRLPCGGQVSERRHRAHAARGAKRGVLFGYGNYAKTVILPSVTPFIDVVCVHELDPMQIPRADNDLSWDTAEIPHEDEIYDAYFLAGFHHTHAPLAVSALQSQACAVVEKPLATDEQQLAKLLEAMSDGRGRLYSCFHKRYSPQNALALRDLQVAPGDPISYHCIVYEVPLPSRHWYRWPTSRSRLVSNGCHWIDHFLFLNSYAEVVRSDVVAAADGSINCSIELENGAFFSMALTEHGSDRIGLREYVELRAGGTTVRMRDGGGYEAENRARTLRRARTNKMESYRNMYREIAQRIASGAPGDSLRTVALSAGTVLTMDDQLEAAVRASRPRERLHPERGSFPPAPREAAL